MYDEVYVEMNVRWADGFENKMSINELPYTRLHELERPKDFHSKPSCCQFLSRVVAAKESHSKSKMTGKKQVS